MIATSHGSPGKSEGTNKKDVKGSDYMEEINEVWVVAHQIPRDWIVAIYTNKEDAEKHEDIKKQTKHATIIYPCENYMLEHQSGYHPNVQIKDTL